MNELLKQLQAPFSSDLVKWKVQTAGEKWATCVAYVDSRIVAQRLDDVTGGMWQDEYREVGGLLICRIGIYSLIIEQWIWREDTGTESNIDKEKGHVSDAFKRAGVKWGIGRGLYDLPIINLQTVKNWKNKDVPSYGNKALFGDDVTRLCRKLIDQKGTDKPIWFKSNEEVIK